MPFETIVDRVFLPMWIIFVPVSSCCLLFTTATLYNSPTELSPCKITLGYFHVIAEPVSTCVHEIFEFTPTHFPRLVTKLKMPPLPSASPAYQFCTVEYFTEALSSAMSSTTAACSWFSSRLGAVHPSR